MGLVLRAWLLVLRRRLRRLACALSCVNNFFLGIGIAYHTLFRDSASLVLLEFFLCAFSADSRVAFCFCKLAIHLLAEQIKTAEFVDGILRRLLAVVDDKGLAFALQALFRNDVDNVTIFGEDLAQGVNKRLNLDSLIEIFDVDTATYQQFIPKRGVRTMCNVRTLRWVESLRLP